MQIKMIKQLYIAALLVQCLFVTTNIAMAGNRFTSSYPCSDATKTCVSSGMRKIDGLEVHRDCWEYSYIKTCNYPSKNDCRLYEHCYAVANPECLLKDSLGSCVNLKREFSCKSWQPNIKENQEARVELVAKDGTEGLICKSIPCIDGNCIDKSYLTNGEMMDSVSKFYAASYMKPDKDYNFNLFAGYGSHCSKKPIGHSNCCPLTVKGLKGWGMQLGAKCSKDEISLIGTRSKNLCVYVGKQSTKKVGVTTVTKHHFCCFGNMLEKVIQVEGRKQLGINFGNGGSPNCRGLTMQEIQTLDFSRMDFSEFINELMVKFTGTYKAPNPDAIADTIQSHMNIRKYDGNEDNADNRFAGLNTNIKDNSWEAEEERRIAVQKAEQARLARFEEERQEQARIAKLAQLAEGQKRQRIALDHKITTLKHRIQEIKTTQENMSKNEYLQKVPVWNALYQRSAGKVPEPQKSIFDNWYDDYNKRYMALKNENIQLQDELHDAEHQLKRLR